MAVNLLHKLPKTYSINGIQYYTITGEKVKGNKTVKNCHALKSQVNDVKNLTKSNNHQINNMSDSKRLNDVNRINEASISNKKNMTLKEKFALILMEFWSSDWESKCEQEADEFAIGFAEWCIKKRIDFFDSTEIGETYTIDGFVSKYKMNELLEIYKKESNL